jgi:hypothetical protein
MSEKKHLDGDASVSTDHLFPEKVAYSEAIRFLSFWTRAYAERWKWQLVEYIAFPNEHEPPNIPIQEFRLFLRATKLIHSVLQESGYSFGEELKKLETKQEQDRLEASRKLQEMNAQALKHASQATPEEIENVISFVRSSRRDSHEVEDIMSGEKGQETFLSQADS